MDFIFEKIQNEDLNKNYYRLIINKNYSSLKISFKNAESKSFSKTINFSEFKSLNNQSIQIPNSSIDITLYNSNNKRFIKNILLNDFKDNNNNLNEQNFTIILNHIDGKQKKIKNVNFNEFIPLEENTHLDDISKIEMRLKDINENIYEKIISLSRIKVNNENNNNSNLLFINEDYKITIQKREHFEVIYDCKGSTDFYLAYKIFSFFNYIRILLQIGDIYISLILFGIFIETIIIIITSTKNWLILLFSLPFIFLIVIFYILPLSIQFWEAFKFRFINEKNPYIIIFKTINYNCNCNNLCDFILNIFGCIMLILYIISLCLYNSTPGFFEILNLINIIILPLIKFSLIFLSNVIIGFMIIMERLNTFCSCDCDCCTCLDSDAKIKEILNYDQFIKKIESNESKESFEELEPIRLLMYDNDYQTRQDNNTKGNSPCSRFKFICCIIVLIINIILYIVAFCLKYFSSGYFLIYLIFFWLFIFSISAAVPNPLFYCNYLRDCSNILCNSNYSLNKVVENIEKKYQGLKHWIFGLIVSTILIIFFLLLNAFKIDDLEYQTVDKRLGPENIFNKTYIEDLTEQSFSRDYIKNPMCYTSIHHLNFIQLVALTQASYITEIGDIQKVKNIYYKNTIFKDSEIKLINMEFLTTEDDIVVLLKIDFEMPNSDKNLTVFSIRGSVSNKDWLLDLEMFAPSTIYNIMKMIPIIQRSESFLSEAINFFLTFPLISMGDITILKYYSDKIIEKIDSIIKTSNNTEFIFVGHSLGGGLSKYIASYYKKQSFSVSGPGITPLEYQNSEIYGYNKYFKTNFIDIIPDNDLIPRLEISGGAKYRVLCNKSLLTCHSVDRTLCMMGIMCEQEEYTKKLCLSMPGIGEDKYKDMKKLKNGDKFCNNYILNSPEEKNICKNADATSRQHKCCYIHLNYFSLEMGKQIDKYKCLQFDKENEILKYKTEFKKKYSTEPEIECNL